MAEDSTSNFDILTALPTIRIDGNDRFTVTFQNARTNEKRNENRKFNLEGSFQIIHI